MREPNARYLVKPAYKQTEVGVIPEDWVTKSIFELATIKTGPFGTLLKAAEYSGGDGVPLISVGEVREGFLRVTDHTPRVPEAVVRRLPQYVLKKGDIVFGRKGGVERSALIRAEQEGWFLGSDGISVRPVAGCHSEYLGLQFQSSRVKEWLLQNAIGTTMPSLNQSILGSVVIPLPPTKAEQQAIAEALSDADALIEALEQLLTKKRQIKQGAMQELLTGQKRLPGFAGEWFTVKAGEVGCFSGGNGFPTRFQGLSAGEYPFFKVSDMNSIGNETFLDNANNYIDEGVRRQLGAKSFPKHSIVFAKVGAAVFLERKKVLSKVSCLDNNMAAFVVDASRADWRFVHFSFLSINFGSFVSTTALPSLSGKTLSEIDLQLPPIEEQTAIATILSDMDTELAALETRLAKARQLKQGMMQELLTGRIRLVQPRAEVIPFPVKEEAKPEKGKSHNWQINEAVVISVLAKHFGSAQWPLGRKRYTKLSYLLHRHVERQAEGYLKKAAGPYNPATKYKGPEGIALKKGYVQQHTREQFSGFVAGEHIEEAETYFRKWYGEDVLVWLAQFRLKKNDDLELLATVDMAMEDLRRAGRSVALDSVKEVIRSHPEWQAKLDRPIFSDGNIERAIVRCNTLFGQH